jgi:hypothetical protein
MQLQTSVRRAVCNQRCVYQALELLRLDVCVWMSASVCVCLCVLCFELICESVVESVFHVCTNTKSGRC